MYRGKSKPTDVLSFPADGERREIRRARSRRRKSGNERRAVLLYLLCFLNFLYLLSRRYRHCARHGPAKRRLYGRTLEQEMRILILHGILHLMGYDHETDTGQMERREQRLRRSLGISLADARLSLYRRRAGADGWPSRLFLPRSRLSRSGARQRGADPRASGRIRSVVEPRFHMERARAAATFNMLARLWLVLVATMTAHGVTAFVQSKWQAAAQMVVFLGAEVIVLMQFVPSLLLAGAPGNWLAPFVPLVRVAMWIVWPVQSVLQLLVSVLHLSEPETEKRVAEQQAIEAFVDAATEEGIIEQDDARLIEQVMEFGDKRVRDVMTPRPGRRCDFSVGKARGVAAS